MLAADDVVDQPDQVHAKLAGLGLTLEILQQAVREAAFAKAQTTPNHPLTAGGSMQYFEGVRSLRDQLVPLRGEKWEKDQTQNRGLVVNRKRGIVIGVASGDSGTGRADSNPTTSSTKGLTMKQAVSVNQMRFEEFGEYFGTLNAKQVRDLGTLWLLLIHVDPRSGEVRSELSRPVHWEDEKSRPVIFKPRIILPPMEPGTYQAERPKLPQGPQQTPEVIVEIKRRA